MKHHEILAMTIIFLTSGCDDQTCSPGATQSCVCPGGGEGAQVCSDSGSRWGPCDCGTTDASTDTTQEDTPGTDTTMDAGCTSDADCDNGIFCDGTEVCVEGECQSGVAVVCDDVDDCTTDRCDEGAGECVFADRDEDGDGFIDADCGGDDCEDDLADVYPGAGASDTCPDSLDNDCDGQADELGMLPRELELDTSAYGLSSTWTGSGFAFAYEKPEGDGSGAEVWIAVGSTDLTELLGPTQITDALHNSSQPSIAWTGSEYGFVWMDERDGPSSYDIYFTRLQPDGTEIGDDVLVAADGFSSYSASPEIVWTGSEYGMTLVDTGNLHFSRISAEGVEVGSRQTIGSMDDLNSRALIWSGSEFAVVVVHDSNLWLQRLSFDGTAVGSEVQISQPSDYIHLSEAVWTGSEYTVLYTDETPYDSVVRLRRFAPDGTPIGSSTSISGDVIHCTGLSLTWTGSGFVAGWMEGDGSGVMASVLHVSMLDPDGTLSVDHPVDEIAMGDTPSGKVRFQDDTLLLIGSYGNRVLVKEMDFCF